MTSLFHTTGIVLSQRPYREADRWYSILTYEHGKLECLARGASKPLAKLAPHLEMPAISEFHLVDGRHYPTIVGVERKEGFQSINTNYEKLILYRNAMHLVEIGTRSNEQDQPVYNQVIDWIRCIDRLGEIQQERSAFLLASFGLKLLAVTGYKPELFSCLSCRYQIEPGQYRWHALKGGVVCDSCVIKHNQTWFAARPMQDDVLKLIRFSLEHSFEDQLKPHLAGASLLAFHEAIESLIISHFPTIPANSLRGACQI